MSPDLFPAFRCSGVCRPKHFASRLHGGRARRDHRSGGSTLLARPPCIGLFAGETVRWLGAGEEIFEVLIPRDRLRESLPAPEVRLVDELGEPRTDLDVGEGLTVYADGLKPAAAHDALLQDDQGESIFAGRLMSDRYGVIESALLWPQFGLIDPSTGERLTVEEAREQWTGRRLTLSVALDGEPVVSRELPLADTFLRPLVLGTDEDGRVLSGFVAGERDALVSGYNVPFEGPVRVYLVSRRHDWRSGDPFTPVLLRNRRAAFADTEVEGGRFGVVVAG